MRIKIWQIGIIYFLFFILINLQNYANKIWKEISKTMQQDLKEKTNDFLIIFHTHIKKNIYSLQKITGVILGHLFQWQ